MQSDASPNDGKAPVTLLIRVDDPDHRADDGGGTLHGGLQLIGRLTVEVSDAAVPYDIAMTVTERDGWLACESVTVTARPGGPPVTGAALRAPTVAKYLDLMRARLAEVRGGTKIARVIKQSEHAVHYGFPSTDDWAALDFGQRRRAAQLTPELVAACYREALASPDPRQYRRPTAAVAERLSASRGHISRVLTAARRQGLPGLDPPTGRK
jgi:hypothetical protein